MYRTPPNNSYNIGWGPRVGTPFIWLAGGGDGESGMGHGGNPDAETLLIVTNRKPLNPSDAPLDTLHDIAT